ncbi:MAG: putative lipid II flippase FtsW [Desulfovibrio sp.]|uniref:putative lipid II flippase FtsW n=1 Tax=Desulfovibrio sp. 7SRBS1 TaxID=3378064 RepID=UPI003B42166B
MNAPAAKKLNLDYVLLISGLLLAGIGVIMVLSASGIMAEKFWDSKYHFFYRQALFTLIGTGLMTLCIRLPRAFFYRLTYLWLILAFALLSMTLGGPLTVAVNGASRWLRVGPFTLQPLETAKIALVIYLAYFFSGKQDMIKRFSIGFLPPFLMTGALCLLLLLQPDFGGAVFLCLLLFLMCLAGGTRFVHLFFASMAGICAAALLIMHSPYRFRRLFAFLDPFKDAQDVGYQLVQSLYAFGAGGLSGVGLGAGKQKLFFLPEAHNDFLMAVVGEETGFIGVSLIIILIAVLLWRAFAIAIRQEDLRDRYTAYGLTLILALGFVLNLAVVLGAMPPKGVPMPFVSYGGSQVIVSFICLGLLLNLSRTSGGMSGATAGGAR